MPAEHDVAPSMGGHRVHLLMSGHYPAHRDQVGFIGSHSAEVAIESQHPLGRLALTIVKDNGEVGLWTRRVQPIGEAGHDPKVASAAAQPPEKLGVLFLVSHDHPAVSSDNVSLD